MSLLHFIFLLILVLSTSTYVYSFSNNVTDEQSLLSFKASITDDPLGVLSSWNNSIHFCHWKGVTCSTRRQRVTELNLSSQHLVGTLSPHIGNLSFLEAIDTSHNEFHGPIPNEIGRLFRLQSLYLNYNSFEGGFPFNLSHCVDIRNISMYNNSLQGELPTEFASWSKLYLLSLGSNHFIGSIPPSIGNVSSIRFLQLSGNNLTGRIPLEVAHLAKLESISLSSNRLWGTVPLAFYNMSSIRYVDIADNEFEGTLPPDMGFTLPKLQFFSAGINRLTGPLPPSIANASNLVYFAISYNNITGPITMDLGSLSYLQQLNLGVNKLGENQPPDDLMTFFKPLVNCTNLRSLVLNKNSLRGELPNYIFNFSATMEILDLSDNHVHGSISHAIGKLVNMEILALSGNFFKGTIPESIGTLSRLGKLDLGENLISGVIPTSIINTTQLIVLNLDFNKLQGSMPTGIFNISTLQILDLTNNGLGGVIPEEIGFMSQCRVLYLGANRFTGPLPSNIGYLRQLVKLDVSSNRLKGDIPASLGDCVMLEELHMQGNLFQGKIPSSLKVLKSLVFLDLSCNNISGIIPSFFHAFILLEFLDLSNNKLVGEVPKEGLFSNSSAFSITGNLRLCGGIQALQLSACGAYISKNKKKRFPTRVILLVVLLPLAILLTCLALIFNQHKKSKEMHVLVTLLQDNQHPLLRFSYQDLLLATNEFSPNNLLGEGRYGSVYRGVLQSVEKAVAVKVMNVEVRGANKSFLAECGTLRNVRHRNLVKIITACSSTDFKGNNFEALVFELMANGSLDNWLHPSPSYEGNERNLTLLQRLNISIDVALGVDYLHNHSHTSIIHCDIKPSNILLDEEFVARVGDFGLARFSFATTSGNQGQMSSIGVCGTVGYVPPEYGMGGKISTQGDVYSYGILLLELFSGIQPTSTSIFKDSANNLHDYVRKALQQRVLDITDPGILRDQEYHDLSVNQSYSRAMMEACLKSVFEVGVLCSVETPRERIDINVAVKQLILARDKLLQCMQGQ